jgi:DNA polymerase-3 subunit delta
VPDWPTDGWQALHRLALTLCRECAVQPNAPARKMQA